MPSTRIEDGAIPLFTAEIEPAWEVLGMEEQEGYWDYSPESLASTMPKCNRRLKKKKGLKVRLLVYQDTFLMAYDFSPKPW